jgi:hypothetical protein
MSQVAAGEDGFVLNYSQPEAVLLIPDSSGWTADWPADVVSDD